MLKEGLRFAATRIGATTAGGVGTLAVITPDQIEAVAAMITAVILYGLDALVRKIVQRRANQ